MIWGKGVWAAKWSVWVLIILFVLVVILVIVGAILGWGTDCMESADAMDACRGYGKDFRQ